MGWTDEAMELMAGYAWPGNVRELQNICERAVVISVARDAVRIEAPLVEPWLRSSARPASNGIARFEGAELKPAVVSGGAFAGASGSVPGNGTALGVDAIRPLSDIERETIVQTLTHFHGHRQKTAKALGIGVRTLGLKLKKWKEEELVPATL